jgi:uncharacterized protein (DUF2164 family)
MPKAKRDYKLIREQAKNAWLNGEKNLENLAKLYHVGLRTLEKYKREDKWADLELSDVHLDQKLERVMKEASIKAFEDYITNPADKEKQSLTNLIKHLEKKLNPTKELNDYILKFLDQLIDYLYEQGMDDVAQAVQANIHDIAEHLRVKNNG